MPSPPPFLGAATHLYVPYRKVLGFRCRLANGSLLLLSMNERDKQRFKNNIRHVRRKFILMISVIQGSMFDQAAGASGNERMGTTVTL